MKKMKKMNISEMYSDCNILLIKERMKKQTSAQPLTLPKAKELEIQESTKIEGGKYTLKRVGQDEYSCSCMAWKNQSTWKGTYRTCKHIDSYLAEHGIKAQVSTADASTGSPTPDSSKSRKRESKADEKVAANATKVCASKEEEKEEKKGKKEKKPVTKKAKIELAMMLANVYDPDKLDPTGWYMSEKLDGVRCFWNGNNFYSRAGNPFYPPSYFKEALPKDFQLDGELWTERDDFQKCVSIVKRQDENDEWKKVRYMIFDAPAMNKAPFTERLEKL